MGSRQQRDAHGHFLPTHGMWKSITYRRWETMLRRCYDVNHEKFKWYGGRGVVVDERWRGEGGFERFLADLGECPQGLTLDRLDPSGNYEPRNCAWKTWAEQRSNLRRHYSGEGNEFIAVSVLNSSPT